MISCWKAFHRKTPPPHIEPISLRFDAGPVPSHPIRNSSRESPIARVVQIWLPTSTGCPLAHQDSSAELRIPQPAKSPPSLPTAHPSNPTLAAWFETDPCVVDTNLTKDRASLLGSSFGTGRLRSGHQDLMFFSCGWDALVGLVVGINLMPSALSAGLQSLVVGINLMRAPSLPLSAPLFPSVSPSGCGYQLDCCCSASCPLASQE